MTPDEINNDEEEIEYRLPTKLEQIGTWFRYLWQRITRGWDNRELWNLDTTIAKFALPRLIEFRETGAEYGHPCDLTHEEWLEIIDKIIYAMRSRVEDLEPDALSLYQEYAERVQEGFELFGKWFGDLWW